MRSELLEPCAGTVARTVLRGGGAAMPLPYPAVRISITSSLADCGDERTLPLSLPNR